MEAKKKGAPAGNQFWKQRATSGRRKIFSSPAELWKACCEYFEATDKRKWTRIEFNGKDAVECKVPTETPYTQSGLQLFLDIDENTWQRYGKAKEYKEFWAVVSRVNKIIYTHKFEGAVVGAFNANIIARDLGLADKSELKADIKQPISDEQLDKILTKINGNSKK